jgi:hypothetical protein
MSVKIPAYLHTTQIYTKPLLKAFPGEINISVSGKGYDCVPRKKKTEKHTALHFKLLSGKSEQQQNNKGQKYFLQTN